MTKIALLGAGGKMGVRLSTNLKGTRFDVDHVEVSEEGRARLKETLGIECMEQGQAVSSADAVVMAVPDRLIGKILKTFVADLRPGAKVIMLDAAAPHAGELPERDDITYFVTHPCHPPIFNDETDPKAKTDYFGGVHAKQHIVCALMQGPESHYAECEEIAREIYKPVMRAHRCTVEQLAILEPALSETVGATFALALARGDGRGDPARRSEAGRDRLHHRASQHRTRDRLRHISRGPVLGRRLAGDRRGEAGHLPRRMARSSVLASGGASVGEGHLRGSGCFMSVLLAQRLGRAYGAPRLRRSCVALSASNATRLF